MLIISIAVSLLVFTPIAFKIINHKKCPKCGSHKTEKMPSHMTGGRWLCNLCGWVFLFLLLLSAPVFAGEKSVTVQGGWLHTPNSNYGDSGTVSIRPEMPLFGDLSVAVEGTYHGATSHNHNTGTYGDVSGLSLLPELIYYPSFGWQVQPYILGGLGWSWWNFDRSQDMRDKGIAIDLGNSFAKKVAAGVVIPLKNEWSLTIEWSYFQSHVPKDSYFESDGSFANVLGDDDRSGRITIGQEETNIVIGLRRAF